MLLTVVRLCVVVALSTTVQGLNNGLALTPPMGWMTWERYRCTVDCNLYPNECISESLMKRAADLLVSEGYADAGYKYVVLDDCWLAMNRSQDGFLQPNATRFPSGMLDLSNYIHNKGLKFGLYEDYGTKTCAGYPGVLGYIERDAKTFASWEVDYVKLDGCYADPLKMDNGYPEYGRALNSTGRSVIYSCSWPVYQQEAGILPNFTLISEHCNLWRNYDDIEDSWESVESIMDYFATHQGILTSIAGPGHWNDPDMLIIGNFGLSYDQSKAQMAVWCILAAPLMISTDLVRVRPELKAILQNKDAIAIDQDSLGIQGRLILTDRKVHVWRKPILPVVGLYMSYGVAFVNRAVTGMPLSYKASLSRMGLYNPGGYRVFDIFKGEAWPGRVMPSASITIRINPTSAVFLRFTALSDNDVPPKTR